MGLVRVRVRVRVCRVVVLDCEVVHDRMLLWWLGFGGQRWELVVVVAITGFFFEYLLCNGKMETKMLRPYKGHVWFSAK